MVIIADLKIRYTERGVLPDRKLVSLTVSYERTVRYNLERLSRLSYHFLSRYEIEEIEAIGLDYYYAQ